MTTTKKTRKTRKDIKLTPAKLQTIEQCLKLGLIQEDIAAVTGINRATIAAIKLTLSYVGRL